MRVLVVARQVVFPAALATALTVALAAVVAAALAVALAAALAGECAAFPLVGAGDIRFRLDHASFRSGVGTTESEFYLEVDNVDLGFRVKDGRLVANAEFHLEFHGGGKHLGGREYPLEFGEGAPAGSDGAVPPEVAARRQVVQLRIPLPAGTDSVAAEIQDRNARKRGIVYLFTKTPKSGFAAAPLVLRRFPEGEISVSDIEFARPFGGHAVDPTFVKSGLDVEPNPGRVYGAPDRIAATYLEAYDLHPWQAGERRQYELTYVLRDQDGTELRTWQRKLSSQVETWADTTSFDVSTLPAGTYALGVIVKEAAGGGRALVESSFDVVWASASWTRWLAETESVVPFLLDGIELDNFLALRPGAKERYLDQFWASRDPTPGQGNEIREEFNRRIAFANYNYTTTLEPGMRTDRGRIYIKYGEPDEVQREVIPVQGNDINEALEELDRSTAGDLTGSRTIDPEDSRSFEIWIYDYRGQELFPKKQMSTSLGLQFVFVDDLGVGDFRLIRASDQSDY